METDSDQQGIRGMCGQAGLQDKKLSIDIQRHSLRGKGVANLRELL